MYAKLAFRNVRKSIADYGVYFVTILLGVAVFYAFNTIQAQEVLLDIESGASTGMLERTHAVLRMFSYVVAFVLGFLVVYANGFLIRRRKQEFGTYLMLGMRTGGVSAIILLETVLVGLLSLVAGIALGYLLSQGLTFVTAALFESAIKEYRFIFSMDAFLWTLSCFGLIYAVVAVVNVVAINRCRLVDLLGAHLANQRVIMRNPWLCVLVTVAAVAVLAWAYAALDHNQMLEFDGEFALATVLMLVGTLLLFWGVAGFAVAVLGRTALYRRGITAFTVRQIASRMNTAFVSMWVVCVLLFFSITTFATGMGLLNALTGDIKAVTRYDATLHVNSLLEDGRIVSVEEHVRAIDAAFEAFERSGGNALAVISEEDPRWAEMVDGAVELDYYAQPGLTYQSVLGELGVGTDGLGSAAASAVAREIQVNLVRASQFDGMLELAGEKPLELGEDEFAVNNTAFVSWPVAEAIAGAPSTLDLAGHTLRPARFVNMEEGTSPTAAVACTLVLPDVVVDDLLREGAFLAGSKVIVQYAVGRAEGDAFISELSDELGEHYLHYWPMSYHDTALRAAEQIGGVRILVVYLAVYIGLVFLVATAALLAIRLLTDCADSVGRYVTLDKLGTDRKELRRSLRHQVEVYFLAPLAVALCHMGWTLHVMGGTLFPMIGFDATWSIALVVGLVVVVFGGYMAVTYGICKGIVRRELQG